MSQAGIATKAANRKESDLAATILRVAWLAILLGVGMELLLLIVAAFRSQIPGIEPIIAGLVQKVSWSGLVCTGLAFGKAASNSNPGWMALAGLFSAPTAFSVARALHKSTAHALKAAEGGAAAAFPLLIAGLKGLEYAALGLILGWVGKRFGPSLMAYGSTGLAIGVVFGTPIAELATPGGFGSAKIIPVLVNEVLFPVGCSLALYAAEAIGKKAAAAHEPPDDD
ncbi:MAG: hypothetical protein FJ145_02270 [Deltaproteobacteria bacterium]|nr:hypothetical protein [Deltaproteobacteria bacterium]